MQVVRVLVAEGGAGLQSTIARELKDVPGILMAEPAADAASAVRGAAAFGPHIVVLGTALPGTHWTRVLARLRALPMPPEVLICPAPGVVTVDAGRARQLGAFAVLEPRDVLRGVKALVVQLRSAKIVGPRAAVKKHDGVVADPEAASQRLRELFAAMSHHVRTPLNGVLGLAYALLDTDLTEEQRELLEGIRSSGDRLAGLVDDMFDLARCETGQLAAAPALFDPRELVQGAVREALALAGPGAGFHPTVAPSVPAALVGDAWRIRKLLLHAFSTCLTGRAHALGVEISISDEGPSPLSLVVVLTALDGGGRVTAMPRSCDLRVHESVPRDPAAVRAALGARLIGVLGADLARRNGDRPEQLVLRIPVTLPTAPAASRSTTTTPRVLVVDDEPVNQLVAARLLIRMGIAAEIAANGQEAVERAGITAYDLIIMDCQMPVMNGLEATRAIRRNEPEGRRTPIVALTASMTDLDRDGCLQAGMDDLVRKPVSPELLHAMLRRWTGFVATTGGHQGPRASRSASHGEAV